jgi:dimeric dUTPase (all-alpha-NTP-PPase superfamily)
MENDNLIVTKIKAENYRVYNKKGRSLRVPFDEAIEAMAYSPNYWVKMEKVENEVLETENLQGEKLTYDK